jgi:hypothetical protein
VRRSSGSPPTLLARRGAHQRLRTRPRYERGLRTVRAVRPAFRQTQDEAPASPARAVALFVAGLALAADEDRGYRASDAKLMLRLANESDSYPRGQVHRRPRRDRVRETPPRRATQIVVMGHRRPRTAASKFDSPIAIGSGLSQAWSPASATPSTRTSGKRHCMSTRAGGQRLVTQASPRPNPAARIATRTCVDATERSRDLPVPAFSGCQPRAPRGCP